jgi:two-component sensor histidine kinase
VKESCPDGRISVTGKLDHYDGSGSFLFSWKESGGPRVSPPTRKGFGGVILQEAAEQFGDVTIDYSPGGLVYQLRGDLKEIEGPKSAIALSSTAAPLSDSA